MWTAIGSAISMLLPLAIKLIMYWIDRKNENDELKKQFLIFLSKIDHELPPKMHSKYKDQIDRIKADIEADKK